MADRQFVFTMTTGRSGTAYLAELLAANLPDAQCHHEIIAWESFGVDTPDLSHLTLFNSHGNVEKVQGFWHQKLARIATVPVSHYVETSHLLMKAGLNENLTPLMKAGRVHLINLQRDPAATIASFRARYDLANKGSQWLWYLDPDYPRNLCNPKEFLKFGINGMCLWYITEIRLRAAYYELLLAGQANVTIHHASLEDLQKPVVVSDLLKALGMPIAADRITMPSPQNVGPQTFEWAPGERQMVDRLIKEARFDAPSLAAEAIKAGRSFQPVWPGEFSSGTRPPR
jgi:hypothetical protein